jgi:hypothetical protein
MTLPEHEIDLAAAASAMAGRMAEAEGGRPESRGPRPPSGQTPRLPGQVGERALQRREPAAQAGGVDLIPRVGGRGGRRRGGESIELAEEGADARDEVGFPPPDHDAEALLRIDEPEGRRPGDARGTIIAGRHAREDRRRPRRGDDSPGGDDDQPPRRRLRRPEQRQRGVAQLAGDGPAFILSPECVEGSKDPPADQRHDGRDDGEKRRAVAGDGERPVHRARVAPDSTLVKE